MDDEPRVGIMRAFGEALREISGTDIPITDIEGFEKLVCAVMDFVSLILFQMWKAGDFTRVRTFSNLLNDFNKRILKLARADKSSIEALRDEMNVELKAK